MKSGKPLPDEGASHPEADRQPVPPQPGSPVTTACNECLEYHSELPHAVYQGEVVYFCLPACKEDFERDPQSSCFAYRCPPFK